MSFRKRADGLNGHGQAPSTTDVIAAADAYSRTAVGRGYVGNGMSASGGLEGGGSPHVSSNLGGSNPVVGQGGAVFATGAGRGAGQHFAGPAMFGRAQPGLATAQSLMGARALSAAHLVNRQMGIDLALLRRREAIAAHMAMNQHLHGFAGAGAPHLSHHGVALAPAAFAANGALTRRRVGEEEHHAKYHLQQRSAEAFVDSVLMVDSERSNESASRKGAGDRRPSKAVELESPRKRLRPEPKQVIKMPKPKEVIEILDDTGNSDVEESKATEEVEMTQQNRTVDVVKRAAAVTSTNRQQPVVVVQNWSKDALLDEIKEHCPRRHGELLSRFLESSTGYNEDTAPAGIPFPPEKMNVKLSLISQLIRDTEAAIYDDLSKAIDVAFHKCAQFVDKSAAQKLTASRTNPDGVEQTKPTQSPQDVQLETTKDKKLRHQALEISNLRATIDSLTDKREEDKEQVNAGAVQSKLAHARTVRAYMRASIASLNHIRNAFAKKDSIPSRPHSGAE